MVLILSICQSFASHFQKLLWHAISCVDGVHLVVFAGLEGLSEVFGRFKVLHASHEVGLRLCQISFFKQGTPHN